MTNLFRLRGCHLLVVGPTTTPVGVDGCGISRSPGAYIVTNLDKRVSQVVSPSTDLDELWLASKLKISLRGAQFLKATLTTTPKETKK